MEKENNSRIYELGYLLVGTMPEETVAAKVGALKDLFEKAGGMSVSEEFPKLMTLAYEMSRPIGNKKAWFKEGYFGWMKFDIDPAAVEDISATLGRDEDVLRYLLIKTVRENTVIGKRTFSKEGKRPARKVENAAETPIDEAEIEKKLEELAVAE